MKEKTFLTLREASILVNKTDLTIRRLIKTKKIPANLENGIYMIKKSDLLDFYGIDEENSIEETNIKPSLDMTSLMSTIESITEPLKNYATYYYTEWEKAQRLLTESKEERERKEQETNKILQKKDRIIQGLIILLIIAFLFFGILYLIISGRIIIKF